MTAYTKLEGRFHRLLALREAAGFLEWDQSTMMPEGGRSARAEHLSSLAVVCHELITDRSVGELLEEAAGLPLDDEQRANLREMQRSHIHATALDGAFVEAFTRARSRCEAIWREARPKSDFAMIEPALSEVMALTREAAQRKAPLLGCSPYEALMDEYEAGLKSAEIDAIFADYAAFLPGFLAEVMERQKKLPVPIPPKGPFDPVRQRELGLMVMKAMGFDFTHGRLDVSLHPFCGGVPEDVRITTRYSEDQFVFALMGIIHETGHALYERGLPPRWRWQPVGLARGMAMHESQSLLMEMQAARAQPFLRYLSPLLVAAFPGNDRAFAPENLARLYTRVEPGFIRVDADEVTYPAHIILRTRLEEAMIAGDLRVCDLPGAWNDGMKELLGLTVPNDRLGVLQDIHWYDGSVGYFPCYSLGAMTAAQLFAAAVKSVPTLLDALGQGDFSPLLGWLGEHVHHLASSRTSREILTSATGRPLDPKLFQNHLRARYCP
ncbi:MAG TPA: carboxypeptidase M32 [Dongiaceae bacterium]|jgi:carboxypeptidase Taq|nr:carboxypeptidase M32 [Dongiaceae bacterium]